MIFRRLRQLSEAKVIKVIQKTYKIPTLFFCFYRIKLLLITLISVVIIFPYKVITTIKKIYYLCFQIIISIFLIFKPDTARANVVLKLMLEKNKKFRVIEEGVMNQNEMGMTKGGYLCIKVHLTCGINNILYNLCNGNASDPRYNTCPIHLIESCPDIEFYHNCNGDNHYFSCGSTHFRD